MNISIRRARAIAAEYGPGECGTFDDFAESTRPLRDDELQPLYRDAIDRASQAADFNVFEASRQLLRLADYVADEARRRGVSLRG